MPQRKRYVTRLSRCGALSLMVVAGMAGSRIAVAAQDAAPPVPAQTTGPPTIVDVRVEQEGMVVTDPVLLALIETTVGEPFSMVEVRESTGHLYGLNRFENIQVLREVDESGPGRMRLIYRLTPVRPIDRMEFQGNLGLSEGTLRRTLRERYGATPSLSRVEGAMGVLRQLYRDNGYGAAVITWQIQPRQNPDRATLVVSIEAGRRLAITAIRWVEEEAPAGTAIGRPDVRQGEPYSFDEVTRSLDDWTDDMRKRGFYEARADPVAEFDKDGVALLITLQRGPHVQVVFTGTCLSRSEQQRLVPIRAEATVNEDLLENSTLDIERYLRERGYRDATAPHSSVKREGELVITFDVTCGPRYVVNRISLTGYQPDTEALVREAVLFKVRDPFVESAVEATRLAIGARYEDLGFNSVKVNATATQTAPERPSDPIQVHVTIQIEPGPQTAVRSIAFSGHTAVGEERLRELIGIAEGNPLSRRRITEGIATVESHYRDLGFQAVAVTLPNLVLNDELRSADLLFVVAEGTQTFIDRIIIEGNERTNVRTIERELTLRPGDPLGATKRTDSEANLTDLGLFRRARIDERPHEGDDRVDLIVHVEEARRTTIGYGGGLEISSRLRPVRGDAPPEERMEIVPRGFFEIGRRNIRGTNRSVNLFTRISAKPKDTVTAPGLVQSSYGVNEYRVFGTYREPKILDRQAELLVTGIAERALRTSYSFVTREGRAEVGWTVSPVYTTALRFSVKKSELFDVDPDLSDEEKPLIDRLFPRVRLSKVSGSLIRNTRRNELDPDQGSFLTVDAEVAARVLGSEVSYVKSLVQLSRYWKLPIERRTVLAIRGVFGAARGFGGVAVDTPGGPLPPGDITIGLEDLPASERFFAGGSTSHRGFSVDGLGEAETFTESGFPTGGNGELLLNSEVRMTLFSAVAGVAFLDIGNVYKRAGNISLGDVRPAVGGGLHYRSPVGPVRGEIGFNLDRRELTPGNLERGYVFHISLGPAF